MRAVVRLLLMMALIAPGAMAQAQAKKNKKAFVDEVSGQGYGVAGCGLGSVVLGPKAGPIQILAATLNGTSLNQSFGITFGTLNCDIPQMGHQAAMFIEMNNEVVRKEMARGRGETVSSLALILKCEDSKLFGDRVREQLPLIFEDGITTYESTRRILQTIEANPDLKSSCATVG